GRIRHLNLLLSQTGSNHEVLFTFVQTLISQNSSRFSIKSLFLDNFSLLSRRISERSAETGEHYITRTWADYLKMFGKALGGGFVTAFTIMFKFLITYLHLPIFYS